MFVSQILFTSIALNMVHDILNEAHRCSIHNKQQIMDSLFCGCFFCKQIFKAYEVKEFINEPKGESTAYCPYCDMDTLIGDASNYPITEEFLAEMNKKWF
jgi:hypothetical protein